jgi:hypothetical protein
MTRKISVLVVAAWVALAVRGQLRICGSCGREDTAGGPTCAYCQAPLPDAPAPEPKPADNAPVNGEASPDAQLAQRAFEAARLDVLAAREEESRHPEVALALYENARALLAVVDPAALPPDTGKALLEGIQRCRGALAVTGQVCPVCGGTGRQQITLQQLAGGTEAAAPATRTTGAACPSCGGRGAVSGNRDVEATRLLILRGRREAGLRLQAAGRVAAGQAWIPPEWSRELMPRALAAVRGAAAADCPACAGLGLAPCKPCSGTGQIPCPNRTCRNGWVEETVANTLSPKTALTRRVKCPVCQGTAKVECPACRGKGAVACRGCKGTGLATPCRTCGGEGVVPCRACRTRRRGEDDRAGCPVCKGSGWMLCERCKGDGCSTR